MVGKGAISQNAPSVFMPSELEEAWNLKHQFGADGCFVAGGSLLQTNWQKGMEVPSSLISLGFIKEMKGWGKDVLSGETYTCIGALTTLALCRSHPDMKKFPVLAEAARNIAAPAIRNQATLGGNVISRFGDAIPALLVLDCQLQWFMGDDYVLMPLIDFIHEGPPDEHAILIAVYIPEQVEGSNESSFYRKIGLRDAFSPSIVTISGKCRLGMNKDVETIRLAAGGSINPPQRLVESEKLLKESGISADSLKKVLHTIKEEFTPIADISFSSDYKKTVAANLIVSELSRIAG
ncbi:FAD binding domain-containing protein [Peribacillus sp. SCS-155]|uniref:FAD binding domain-containing protein n=1 Tax=Peribacillus sedimenti TaxID=3115297 RepID=UPI0039063065